MFKKPRLMLIWLNCVWTAGVPSMFLSGGQLAFPGRQKLNFFVRKAWSPLLSIFSNQFQFFIRTQQTHCFKGDLHSACTSMLYMSCISTSGKFKCNTRAGRPAYSVVSGITSVHSPLWQLWYGSIVFLLGHQAYSIVMGVTSVNSPLW